MSCTIISNNITVPETREAVSTAVRAGIGERAGEWKVVVFQAEDCPGLAVKIEGPKDLRFSWTFLPEEQQAEFIRQQVARGILRWLSLQGDCK